MATFMSMSMSMPWPQRSLLILVGALAILSLLGAVVMVPRVRGDAPETLAFTIVWGDPSSFAVIPVPGHSCAAGCPNRGDLVSGSGVVYPAGQTSGAAIGHAYFMGTGTADVSNWQHSANQLFEVSEAEIWGKGSLEVMGTVNFFGTNYFSIIEGTGIYAMARGQCVDVEGPTSSQVTCQIQ